MIEKKIILNECSEDVHRSLQQKKHRGTLVQMYLTHLQDMKVVGIKQSYKYYTKMLLHMIVIRLVSLDDAKKWP